MVLDKQDIADILKVHKKYDGDLTRMKKDVPFAKKTIIKYLKQKGKDYYYNIPWRFDAKTIARIKKEHGPSNGVARVAVRNLQKSYGLKVSYFSVLKYWRKAKLPIRKRGGNTRDLESRLNK